MNAQETCEEIINSLIAEGFKFQVSKKDVEKAIMLKRGIDERTVQRWLKALTVFQYLKPINPDVYEINIIKVNGFLKMLKENPQTKIL